MFKALHNLMFKFTLNCIFILLELVFNFFSDFEIQSFLNIEIYVEGYAFDM